MILKPETVAFVRGGMLFLEPPTKWRSWQRDVWQCCGAPTMRWEAAEIEVDDETDLPMFAGLIRLMSAEGKRVAGVCWFNEAGPYYANSSCGGSPIFRIGPHATLAGAMRACHEVFEGKRDVSDRASYPL